MITSNTATVARSATEILAWSRETVTPALRSAVDTLPPPVRQIAGYHAGWWDAHGHAVDGTPGKSIRPALALLSAEAVGAGGAEAVPAAVAVELVHNFSLLHDDVMDWDSTRRHRPTAWTVFGTDSAILTGDSLLTLAMEFLASCEHQSAQQGIRALSAAVQDLIDGQCADASFETRTDVELSECLRMAEGKTGSLLGCTCALGAVFGGGNAEQVERLHYFGTRIGLAFQFVDDLLGIWGDPAVTGKPVYSDLQSRKKTLPVVATLTSCTRQGDELAELYRRKQPLSEDELEHAAGLIEVAGGRSWSQQQADELLAQGLRHLEAARPQQRPAMELDALARLLTRRKC